MSAFFIASAVGTTTVGVNSNGVFQLEGNTLTTNNNCPDTNPPAGTSNAANDWAALYKQKFINNPATDPPCGSDGFSFVADKTGTQGDATYWAGGGSKDAYDPALGPWQFSTGDVSPDKNDIVNAFAAAYTSGGEKFIYFGSDRFATNGDAQMGFWFLTSKVCLVGAATGTQGKCPISTPNQTTNAGKFVDPDTGVPVHHKNGDILVLVNFNNGGSLGLAGVFEWTGADGNGGGSAQQVVFGNQADCKTIASPNKFCATSNTGSLGSEPIWPYTSKGGSTTYAASAFIEGGLNLSDIPGAGTCFPTFIAETRSSAGPSSGLSLQAQLKDLAFGQFQLCGSSTATKPVSDAAGQNEITSALPLGSSGVDVYDKATVTINGATPGGSVTFHVCGPTAVDSTATCDTGGTLVGSAKSLVGLTSPATVVSDAFHVSQVGRYCFRADYSGDSSTGVPGSSDHSSAECFIVQQLQPSMTTAQRFVPNDSAHVTVDAGAGDLAGSVRFKLFVNATDCSGTADYDSGSIDITTGTGTGRDRTVSSSNTTAYTTDGTTFKWLVTYTTTNGGHKNVTATCGDEHSSIAVNNGGTFSSP